MGKELRKSRPRGSTCLEAEFTQFLTHKYTPLSTSSTFASDFPKYSQK